MPLRRDALTPMYRYYRQNSREEFLGLVSMPQNSRVNIKNKQYTINNRGYWRFLRTFLRNLHTEVSCLDSTVILPLHGFKFSAIPQGGLCTWTFLTAVTEMKRPQRNKISFLVLKGNLWRLFAVRFMVSYHIELNLPKSPLPRHFCSHQHEQI